jgi:hypothetical protein
MVDALELTAERNPEDLWRGKKFRTLCALLPYACAGEKFRKVLALTCGSIGGASVARSEFGTRGSEVRILSPRPNKPF